MTEEQRLRSLHALSRQEGHFGGVIDVETVALMLELRDERIRDLAEFQRDVILRERRTRSRTPDAVARTEG